MPNYTEAIKSRYAVAHYKRLYSSFLQGLPNDPKLHCQKIIINKELSFHLCQHFMLTINSSEVLFAFSKQGRKVQRRFFYRSTSTGCWRVGSGFKAPRFKKGINEKIGYVHEGQVCGQLETALTKVAAKIDAIDTLCGPDLLHYLTSSHNCPIFSEFKRESTRLFHCDIPFDYKNEISYTTLRHNAIPTQYALSSTELNLARGEELIIKIKNNTALWELLIQGLSNEISTYQFYLEILKSNVRVHIYSLSINQQEIRFEIAHCLNFIRRIVKNGKQINLEPVWVKSVYFPTVSSFGNYRQYPKNLSFLPQKPIDYNLPHHARHRLGQYIRYHSAVKNTGFTYYHHLSAHNEKYNMLVRVFKERYQHRTTTAHTSEFKSNRLIHTSSTPPPSLAREKRFLRRSALSAEAKHHSDTASSTNYQYAATNTKNSSSHQLTCAYISYSARKQKRNVFSIVQKGILIACKKYLTLNNKKGFLAPRYNDQEKQIAVFAEQIRQCCNMKQMDAAIQSLLVNKRTGSLLHEQSTKSKTHATEPHYSTYFFFEIMRTIDPIHNLLATSGGLKNFPTNGSRLIHLVKQLKQHLKNKIPPKKSTLLMTFASPLPRRDFS